MGHLQPPMIIITDNSITEGIFNNCVKQHRSCAMGMQFYWIRDCIEQGHCIVMWKLGDKNLADYSTNITHLPTKRNPKDPVRVCWDTWVQTPWAHDPSASDQ
eukprot:7485848-Ditylum_brightwellii.AAC.1